MSSYAWQRRQVEKFSNKQRPIEAQAVDVPVLEIPVWVFQNTAQIEIVSAGIVGQFAFRLEGDGADRVVPAKFPEGSTLTPLSPTASILIVLADKPGGVPGPGGKKILQVIPKVLPSSFSYLEVFARDK